MTKRALRHDVVSRAIGSHERAMAVLVLVLCACLVLAVNRRSALVASPSVRDVLEALDLRDRLPTVVVAFQIVDCADARAELQRWNDVRDVRVAGVLVGPVPRDDEVTSSILRRSGVLFPVHRDGAPELERLLRSLGFRKTPVVLGFDALGRLVQTSSTANPVDHRLVDALVSRLTASEGS